MSIRSDPLQELFASLADMNMTDLATFASTVLQETIPPPDESVIHFEDVSLDISTGTAIGAKQYPPGFSFDAKAIVFGKQASVSCSIGREIELAGSIAKFEIGPLSVANSATIATSVPTSSALVPTGQILVSVTDPTLVSGPSFSVTVGKAEQKFTMDGGVKLRRRSCHSHRSGASPEPKIQLRVEPGLHGSATLLYGWRNAGFSRSKRHRKARLCPLDRP